MIKGFKHKGLKKFWETGSTAKLQASHVKKLKRILNALDAAEIPDDMDLPGYRLHPYKGGKNIWSVDISGNWRVLFRFEGTNVVDIDYCDPH